MNTFSQFLSVVFLKNVSMSSGLTASRAAFLNLEESVSQISARAASDASSYSARFSASIDARILTALCDCSTDAGSIL
mgnify:CR=1 FL=1